MSDGHTSTSRGNHEKHRTSLFQFHPFRCASHPRERHYLQPIGGLLWQGRVILALGGNANWFYISCGIFRPSTCYTQAAISGTDMKIRGKCQTVETVSNAVRCLPRLLAHRAGYFLMPRCLRRLCESSLLCFWPARRFSCVGTTPLTGVRVCRQQTWEGGEQSLGSRWFEWLTEWFRRSDVMINWHAAIIWD